MNLMTDDSMHACMQSRIHGSHKEKCKIAESVEAVMLLPACSSSVQDTQHIFWNFGIVLHMLLWAAIL
jgi:hypothetical protein